MRSVKTLAIFPFLLHGVEGHLQISPTVTAGTAVGGLNGRKLKVENPMAGLTA